MGRFRTQYALIADSYDTSKAEYERNFQPLAYYVCRPLSYWITIPLLHFSITANSVTLTSLLIAAIIPVWAAIGPDPAYAWVALLSFLFWVLDCVDGNIARVTGAASRLGRILDDYAGEIYSSLVLLTLGILASAPSGWPDTLPIILGLLTAWLHALDRLLQIYYASNHADDDALEKPVSGSATVSSIQLLARSFQFDMLPILILLAGLSSSLFLLLVLSCVFKLLILFYVHIRYLCALWKT